MLALSPYICIHSLWYWMLQRYVYRQSSFGGFELDLLPQHRWSLRGLVASTYTDIITFVHTLTALWFIPSHSLNIFEPILAPSVLVNSQYALELVVYTMTLIRALWNPSTKIITGLLLHHLLAFVLLVSSYFNGWTNIGMLVLIITNSTNISFDYFKYGLMVNRPFVKCISSVVFWVVFYIFRVYLLGQMVMVPVTFNVSTISITQRIYYTPMLYGLYTLQLWWFYRISQITYKHTRTWLNTYIQMTDTSEHIQNDFRQILDHLKSTETQIHKHIRSHSIHNNLPIENSEISSIEETETTVQNFCEKLLSEKTINEINDMADKIIDEALGQWRSVMLRQIEAYETNSNSSTAVETDKKND